MSEQLEVEKRNFQNIRVHVRSIQKYKFSLSMTLIVAIATLLLLSLFGGKIARNGQYRFDIGL